MEKGRAPAMLNTPRSLATLSLLGSYVDDEREVDGRIHAEAESADGNAHQESVAVAGHRDREHRHAVHDRRDENKNLPSARPVREPASDERSGEGVGQNEHEATSEGPSEVRACTRFGVEGAGEFPQRPSRPARLGKPAVLQRDREEQDEEPASRVRDQET